MTEQTSEFIEYDDADPMGPSSLNRGFDPAAETRWWAWLLILLIVLSGAVMFGIIYLVATHRP